MYVCASTHTSSLLPQSIIMYYPTIYACVYMGRGSTYVGGHMGVHGGGVHTSNIFMNKMHFPSCMQLIFAVIFVA